MLTAKLKCLTCGSTDTQVFFEQKKVPAHSVLLMRSKEIALTYPKGNLELAICTRCGFIFNRAFDPNLLEYSSCYEETQGFSSTFNAFHRRLAETLIKRYDLRQKEIIEIGCGKGEFLTLLCELGDNRCIGFDPAYIEERNQRVSKDRIKFITDFYSDKYAHYSADLICCKMTLEHISNTADFVNMVRRAIGKKKETIVFFQVPEVQRILRKQAFWDIYYEHCSYFDSASLSYLFQVCGFKVLSTWTDYGGQYLMIEARPSEETATPEQNRVDRTTTKSLVADFSDHVQSKMNNWRKHIEELKTKNKKVVIWGSGSKAVAFLNMLGIRHEIEFGVDINPFKHDTYLAGTGQKIVAPEFLRQYRPDVVIIMNPTYRLEVQMHLTSLELSPEILTL